MLCRAVGPDGSVISVESDERASELAAANLAVHPQASVLVGKVEYVLEQLEPAVDVVLLDPPRTGAGPALVRGDRRPRTVRHRVRGLRPGRAGAGHRGAGRRRVPAGHPAGL